MSAFGLAATASGQYQLNVEIVQVCDDNGDNCAALDATNDADRGYVYESEVNDIWAQAGITVNFTYSTWNDSDALRLTNTERNNIYGLSNSSGAFPSHHPLGVDTLQVFFVDDHSGTGYNGTPDSGWVGDPLENPQFSARNAGNMSLFIDTVLTSNGRGVMANEGFEAAQLGGTLAHEIGHAMGLRHVNDSFSNTVVDGVNVDPTVGLSSSEYNLMWSGGQGPSYNSGLTLAQNEALNAAQIAAVIHNGLNLDPDGNGIGVLSLISTLAADFNGDGIVDLLDLDILGANWQQSGTTASGDANGDGTVNLLDLDILGAEWQTTGSFASALAASGIAVPEPASLALLGLGGLLIARRRQG